MSDTEYPKVVKVEGFNDTFANLYVTANAMKWAFSRETHTLITKIIYTPIQL